MQSERANGHADTSALTIDDVGPAQILTPADAAEVAAVLADAATHGQAVAPVGGGTKLALGNPPERLDLGISTAALNEIIDYEPTDLTLSVGAGARFADVLATLAEHGQMLPLDVAQPTRATIGGLVATALAGPRRLGNGSLRDLLIGISVAAPDGTVTKAGGMVVKNVSGFDLARLYHGSLGTLGVIVSVNFKVLPLPQADGTVVATLDSIDSALDAAAEIQRQHLLPTALEVFQHGGPWWVAARFTGRAPAVARRLGQAKSALRDSAEILHDEQSRQFWQDYMDAQALELDGSDEAIVRWSVRPSETASLTRHLVERLSDDNVVWLGASVGLGQLIGRLHPTLSDDGTGPLAALQRHGQEVADHVQILAAPPLWKHGIDVWGEPPATLDLMRGLKEQLDPDRVLNPGRFVGHI